MGVILYFVAYILFLPLTFINFMYVEEKNGYFKSTALNIDKFANREFRTLWNKTLITSDGYQFGNQTESISEVLGHNILLGKLSKKGEKLVKILTKEHCINAITTNTPG